MARPIPLKMVNPPARLTECTECAKCCTYVAVPIEPPDSAKDATTILWFLYHEKVSVYRDSDGEWSVVFQTRCQNLRSDLRCGVYDERPHICRDFDNTTCEVNSPEGGREFFAPEEFLSWLQMDNPRVYRAIAKEHVPDKLRA
jgi:hypothetical protein